MDSSVSGKDEIWFLRVCHHVPHELYQTFFAPLSTSPVTLEMRTERREGIGRQVSIICRLVECETGTSRDSDRLRYIK